jgi:hypothetical protein
VVRELVRERRGLMRWVVRAGWCSDEKWVLGYVWGRGGGKMCLWVVFWEGVAKRRVEAVAGECGPEFV